MKLWLVGSVMDAWLHSELGWPIATGKQGNYCVFDHHLAPAIVCHSLSDVASVIARWNLHER